MHNLLGVVVRYAGKRRPAKNRGIGRIDLGPEQVDPKYAAMRDIECPRCAQTMLTMVDKDQYHIKFEACPVCYGTFFDAGEFQDLKEHTVLERFNQMMLTISSKFKWNCAAGLVREAM